MERDSNEEDILNITHENSLMQTEGRCMSTRAMQSLYDLHQNNLLCDAVLRLEDGGVFPIHRAVLSTCSAYFRYIHSVEHTWISFLFIVHAIKDQKNRDITLFYQNACIGSLRVLFTTTLHSDVKTDVLLHGVSSKIMDLILEYAYLRSLKINGDVVCPLLIAADYLIITGVIEICCLYLKQLLAPENCIGVMKFAKLYFCQTLEKDAHSYLMRHLLTVNYLWKTLQSNANHA